MTKPIAVISIFGMMLSIMLLPPVFSRCFAMSALAQHDRLRLWLFSGMLFLCSFLLYRKRFKVNAELTAFFLGILLLMSIELGARLFVVSFKPALREYLALLSNVTYPEFMAYQGHPFLQFTGNPFIGNRGGDWPTFNKFGFVGPDYPYQKPPHVLRIAALGGSTTMDGYPRLLEDFLNTARPPQSHSFQALNFGIGWYTSAHSVVNFVLNVRDFSPDYVIIHDAVNDIVARNTGKELRTDYAHALQSFHEPDIPDQYPLRISIIYRYVKSKFLQPDWTFLGKAILIDPSTTGQQHDMSDHWDELRPYQRNLQTMIDLALRQGIKIVLTTQPYSTRYAPAGSMYAQHMQQCNTIIRNIYQEYHDVVLFVDLDAMMTEKKNEVFVDIVHMNPDGILFKAEQIGTTILQDLAMSP